MKGKFMKNNDDVMMQDELLPEYDLKKLRVRKVGPERKYFAGIPVSQLLDKSAEVSPSDVFVNKGLQNLIRAANSYDKKKTRNSSKKIYFSVAA